MGHLKDECLFIHCRFYKMLGHKIAECLLAPQRMTKMLEGNAKVIKGKITVQSERRIPVPAKHCCPEPTRRAQEVATRKTKLLAFFPNSVVVVVVQKEITKTMGDGIPRSWGAYNGGDDI